MSLVWNSIFGPEKIENIREDDNEEREAHFVLFTRPLESMPNMSAQPLSHWAVIVEYPREPKKVYTFEAGQENKDTDRVVATRALEYPAQRDKGKMIRLGSKIISPKRLLEIALSNSLNGKSYNILVRNCQAWCKEFCGHIAKEFLEEQFWDAENLFLVSLAAVSGLFLASSVMFGEQEEEEKK